MIQNVPLGVIYGIVPKYTSWTIVSKSSCSWDTHGLPVELGVENALGITKEDIGKKITIEDYNNECKKA